MEVALIFIFVLVTNIAFFSLFSDVFVTTDIHNAACIPPSAKSSRSSTAVACTPPTSSSSSTTTTVLHHPHHPLPQTSVPFSPMDQIEELDVVAAYCVGTGYNAPASAASTATATGTPAPTSSILLREPPAR